MLIISNLNYYLIPFFHKKDHCFILTLSPNSFSAKKSFTVWPKCYIKIFCNILIFTSAYNYFTYKKPQAIYFAWFFPTLLITNPHLFFDEQRNISSYFHSFLIISLRRNPSYSFKQIGKPVTKRCFLLNLVEIRSVVLETTTKKKRPTKNPNKITRGL